MNRFAAGALLLGIGFTAGAGSFAAWNSQTAVAAGAPHPIAVQPAAPQVDALQTPPTKAFTLEPDFLTDTDALEALPARIRAACAWTGRIKYLYLDDSRNAIVLVEVEGGGIDSILFSFGQVVRTPVAMDAEEKAKLPDQLFPLHPQYLTAIPAAVEAAVQAKPTETTIDHVALSAIGTSPQMAIQPVHTREVFEPIVTSLRAY